MPLMSCKFRHTYDEMIDEILVRNIPFNITLLDNVIDNWTSINKGLEERPAFYGNTYRCKYDDEYYDFDLIMRRYLHILNLDCRLCLNPSDTIPYWMFGMDQHSYPLCRRCHDKTKSNDPIRAIEHINNILEGEIKDAKRERKRSRDNFTKSRNSNQQEHG